MDERQRELKQEKRELKRAYNREKRRYLLFWKCLTVISLMGLAAFGGGWALETFHIFIPGRAGELLNYGNPMKTSFFAGNSHGLTLCLLIGLVSLLVLVCAVAMWIRGGRRLRMTDASLSYRAFLKERRENADEEETE